MSHRELSDIAQEQRLERSIDLPQRGVVDTVIPELEMVTVDVAHFGGSPRMVVRHPYFGVNSWIRVMPEPGTSVLTQTRGDLHQQEVWGYISNTLPRLLRTAKVEKQILLRQLNRGEIEIQSQGRAYTHWGIAGDLAHRGGTVEQCLSQTDLELTSLAPTFKRRLTFHDPTTLAHEERFGIVKRPDAANPNSVQKFIRLTSGGEFAQEYGRWINLESGTSLASLQEGHVVDLQGQLKKHATTNKNLRHERILYHRQQSQTLSYQVDEDLNIRISNSATGNTETNAQLGTNNTLKITTKTLNFTGTTSGTMTFNNSFTLKSQQINVLGQVAYGNSATQPALLGNNLVNNSLSPLIDILVGLFSAMSPDLASASPSKATSATTLSSTAIALGNLKGTLQAALSTQVKYTV